MKGVSKYAPRKTQGKVRELGIFTIGIGVIIAVVTLWLTFALQPTSGEQGSPLLVVVPLVSSGVYVLLGFLVRKLRTSGTIILTLVLVAAGFVIDLAIGANIVKGTIDAVIILLVTKTGRAAIKEVAAEHDAE